MIMATTTSDGHGIERSAKKSNWRLDSNRSVVRSLGSNLANDYRQSEQTWICRQCYGQVQGFVDILTRPRMPVVTGSSNHRTDYWPELLKAWALCLHTLTDDTSHQPLITVLLVAVCLYERIKIRFILFVHITAIAEVVAFVNHNQVIVSPNFTCSKSRPLLKPRSRERSEWKRMSYLSRSAATGLFL